MTVSASAAKQLAAPARLGHRDVRGRSSALAGSYAYEIGDEVFTGWHSHDLHQLEYAFEGVAQVETADAHYLLPPRQAAWIPAGVEHCTTLTRVRTVSVFFDPAFGLRAHDRVRIIAVAPVIREMMLYARRWPIGRLSSEPVADRFFAALGALVEESLDDELPLRLPVSRHPLVAAAMRYTNAHLADATLTGACAAAATSERSLRRAFQAQAGHAVAAVPAREPPASGHGPARGARALRPRGRHRGRLRQPRRLHSRIPPLYRGDTARLPPPDHVALVRRPTPWRPGGPLRARVTGAR